MIRVIIVIIILVLLIILVLKMTKKYHIIWLLMSRYMWQLHGARGPKNSGKALPSPFSGNARTCSWCAGRGRCPPPWHWTSSSPRRSRRKPLATPTSSLGGVFGPMGCRGEDCSASGGRLVLELAEAKNWFSGKRASRKLVELQPICQWGPAWPRKGQNSSQRGQNT